MLQLSYKSSLLLLIILLCFGNLYSSDNVKSLTTENSGQISNPRVDVNLFFENWEAGLGSWTTKDETSIPPQWKLNNYNPYGGSGLSWHMADTSLGTNGGYQNSWYQVLDTDPINLTGTGQQLTFYHRYKVEAPGGEPAGYNGWDGMNVRISTNGGTSWTVLASPTPAYTATSLYSFGFEHGEGLNVPGWAGSLAAWTQVTFNLSAYAGQTVKIRFAFASDPGYSTPDDATLFGWQVDDIFVTNSTSTLFSNTGTASQMTPLNWAATGADLWKIQSGGAFSGTQFASCNNTSNTYVPNMVNSLSSPYFLLDPMATEIYMDFYLKGSWSDNNVFPNVDYFGAYVQVQGESGRRYVSNITQNPTGNNYVYSNAPATWSLFSLTYSVGIIDLTSLKGQYIRIIFEFESDEDAPIGEGLQIEDVKVWTPNLVPVELTSFTANVSNNNVLLNWSTATEKNNRIFEVERKNGDNEFLMVGYVDGHGTTTEAQHYTYSDFNLSSGKYIYRLKQIDYDGKFEYSNEIEADVIAPLEFKLGQNYPNPFNPSTLINYSLAEPGFVKLAVYNMLGEKVKVLVNEFKEAGHYNINFDASGLTSGAYFYKLETPQFTQMKKMLLTK
jgi:hypothetical protein